MAKLLQLRGGTTSQHSSFTGAVREVTVDTDKDVLVVHDGSTAGGFPAHRDLKGSDIASADPLVIVAGSNYYIVPIALGVLILNVFDFILVDLMYNGTAMKLQLLRPMK